MPEMITLYTERLKLRPFVEDDIKHLIDLDQDPEVMKYVGVKPIPTDELKATLQRLLDRQPLWVNYGTWMADEIASGETIGWFTLKPLPQFNYDYDVGYRLKKRFWGKGFATEGTKFLVNYGFTQLSLNKIMACTHLENLNSQKVLLKSGLKRVADVPSPFDPDFIGAQIAKFEIHKSSQ
jgi:RimJ/RimL family protein N-acetyltransferase